MQETEDEAAGSAAEDPISALKPSAVLGALAPLALMVLAAALRLWQLGTQDLWLDELFTVSVTSSGVGAAVAGVAADTNPPLYFILQALVTPVLGRSEAALRALPVLASVLTVGVVYLVGRRMFSREAGLWAAALFTVSPLAVEYAQEARMYSLLMLAVALATLACVLLVEKPGRGRAVVLGIAFAAVAYTHVYGYMVALLFLLPILALPRLRKRVGRLLALAYGVFVLLFLPWVLAIPTQVRFVLAAASNGSWWGEPVTEVVSDSLARIMRLAPSSELIPSLLFIALLLLGMPFHNRSQDRSELAAADGARESDWAWLLLAVGILPVFIGVVISKYITMVATNRNTLVALPAVCLLMAQGGMRFSRRIRVVLLGAMLLFSLAALPAYYASTEKGQWKDATITVLDRSDAGTIAETYEAALQVSTYADILGKRDALNLMWLSGTLSTDERAVALRWGEEDPIDLSEYVKSRNTLVVVSAKGEMGRADAYLSTLPEWRVVQTVDLGDPVLKVWSRSSP